MAVEFKLPPIFRLGPSSGAPSPAPFGLPAPASMADANDAALNALAAAASQKNCDEARAIAKAAQDDPGSPEQRLLRGGNPNLLAKALAVANKVIQAQASGTGEKLDDAALPAAQAAGARPALVAVAFKEMADAETVTGSLLLVARTKSGLLAQTALAATRAQGAALVLPDAAAAVGAEVKALTAKIDALDKKVEKGGQDLTALDNKMDRVDKAVGSVNTNVGGLKDDVGRLTRELNELAAAIRGLSGTGKYGR